VTSERLITALAVGFLFASGAAILGDATGLELGEGGSADRTGALQGGVSLSFIEFGEQNVWNGIRLGPDAQGVAKLFQFGEGQSQGNHELGRRYDLPITFFGGCSKGVLPTPKSVTSIS